MANPEQKRLQHAYDGTAPWMRFGPYLADRQWGTVREDYSANGDAWRYCTHEMARSKAYRWGEEGIGGVSDDQQRLCFAVALWNGRDAILKERLFGLSGPEGNHAEDVKDYYFYLDSTPTHSYQRMLYKYPQAAFPYEQLVRENGRRGKRDPEFELIDTGVFDDDRYFDVFVTYAKGDPDDLLIEVEIHNRGPEAAPLHVLPHVWFRNTWAWEPDAAKPQLRAEGPGRVAVEHPEMSAYYFDADTTPGAAELLFCENETNERKLYGGGPAAGYFKDGINDHLLHGAPTVNPDRTGTKAAAHYALRVPAGGSQTLRLRLTRADLAKKQPFGDFDATFRRRREEADAFYAALQKDVADADARRVQRQAWAGMLWTKQYYYYDVARWLTGDPGKMPPPESRKRGRNHEWGHLHNAEILSMPDKWEYPWYAAWDTAFHCVPLAQVDAEFAKEQLRLLTREWYMHPNGQLPAYEWKFSDVNPPVHGWATWEVYQIDKQQRGTGDRAFLEEVFHKLLLNFTWWVNRKDRDGLNIFQGGFLGLDNIGVFDRSAPLPTGGYIEQADGTSWMAMYALNMMRMALELARENATYERTATKFFEHFLYIAGAMVNMNNEQIDLWDEQDEFFYDVLRTPDGGRHPLRVRSMVGLIPLFAVEVLNDEVFKTMPYFTERLRWFLENRPHLAQLVSRWQEPGRGERHLLSLLRGHRMKALLRRMLDETEFLSEYGVRGLSKAHQDPPYVLELHGQRYGVAYTPAESDTYMFGGNSNWRGPIWFPVNYMIIESLRRFHDYYGDELHVECPTGSGVYLTLREVADELTRRLTRLFLRDDQGRRPVYGQAEKFQHDPHFRDHVLFYEYFHGDNGRGVGASHQTGWTGLVATLIQPGGATPHPMV
ncbi:MAG: glucosidase [Catalinimonas sp.]